MKKFVSIFLSIFILFVTIFPLVTYASDDIIIDVTRKGITDNSDSRVMVYGSSNSSYRSNIVFQVPSSVLNTTSSFYLTKVSSGNINSLNYSLRYSDVDITKVSGVSSGSAYQTFSSTKVQGASGIKFDDFLDLTQPTYLDNVYYDVFVTAPSADVSYYLRLVPKLTITPTPVVTPTPLPVVSPSPVPSSSPAASPTPSLPVTSNAIVDRWVVKQGQSNDMDSNISVFPCSIEVAESGATLGEFRSGNTYIMHYRLELPLRFYYYNHTGTAYSNPQLIADLGITFKASDDRDVYSYSDVNTYISGNVPYDRMNTMQSSFSGISGNLGWSLFNIPVYNDSSVDQYKIVIEWSVINQLLVAPLVLPNTSDYECTVNLKSIQYVDDLEFNHISDTTSESALDHIDKTTNEILEDEKQHYQEELDKAQEVNDTVSSGVEQLTGLLSSWEIFVMPFTLLKEFAEAIASDGSTSLTFPSFSLMGMQLWPSYTFDINYVKDTFPLLFNSLHIVTGIMIVAWFIRYCQRKWDQIIERESES